MSAREEMARAFAQDAHGDQRYGSEPYMTHLAHVRTVMAEYGWGEDYLVAAWLHDTIEDTAVVFEQLMVFGTEVASMVHAVTGVGFTRRARIDHAFGQMRIFPRAIPLKLGDRIANMRAAEKSNNKILGMYIREYATFRDKLAPLVPPDLQAACAPMWRELDRLASTGSPS